MLRSQTFGKRGVAAPARAMTAPVFVERAAVLEDVEHATSMTPPVLTFGLIFILTFIYMIELKLASGLSLTGKIDLSALVAFGAAGYDRVFGAGEYWRIFLAPLLHANFSHIFGNAIALGFVGIRLEPAVGTGRFFGIFALSALGGIAGSLIGNPHMVVTVGASGAITGLIGGLFVASFAPNAARYDQAAMRRTAARFGAPALLPLLFSAHGQTDYHAHLGGALTGAGVVLIQAAMSRRAGGTAQRGSGLSTAWIVGTACVVLSAVCAVYVHRSHLAPQVMAAAAAPLPKSAVPLPKAVVSVDPSLTTVELLSRLAHADAQRRAGRLFAAEMELRAALTLAANGSGGTKVADLARSQLASVLAAEGRRSEASQIASDLCRTGSAADRDILKRAHICS